MPAKKQITREMILKAALKILKEHPMAIKEFEDIMKGYGRNNMICLYGIEYINFAKNEPKLFRTMKAPLSHPGIH